MPTPSTFQSVMPLKDGNVPMVDANGILPNLAFYPPFVSVTADVTLTAKQSGTTFHTGSATKAINITLPAINTGPFYFRVLIGADYGVTITSATADTIITFNDVAADSVAFSQATEIIGGSFEIFCDGTKLFVLPRLASEAQTIAIVTN